jgi:peptidoglycan/LPS O-acetylase OafA/YrhL
MRVGSSERLKAVRGADSQGLPPLVIAWMLEYPARMLRTLAVAPEPTPTAAVTRTATPLNTDYLDGIRGFAALIVITYHAWQFLVEYHWPVASPSWFRAISLVRCGYYSLTVFMVLSGYCLSLPVARSKERRLSGGVLGFAQRRAWRILPPYYVALVLSVVLIGLIPILRAPAGTPWDGALAHDPFEPVNVLVHFALLQNLFPIIENSINSPMWSVAFEWQIYFVFALILVPAWRRFGIGVAVGLSFVIGFLPLLFGGAHLVSWFIAAFGIGMGAADLSVRLPPEKALRVPWGAIAGCLLLPAFALRLSKFWALQARLPLIFPVGDLAASMAACSYLVGCAHRVRAGLPIGLAGRFFGSWAMKMAGRISYSFYLIHFPALALFFLLIGRHEPSALRAALWMLVVGVPGVLAVSLAFYALVERPTMRAKERRWEARARQP